MRILSGFLVLLLIVGHAAAADSKKEARVTQIIRDVKLMPSDTAARPAIVNDKVREDTGVRTGGDSRSELTFVDLTITRLGANTIFSFNKAGRNAEVDSGSILFRVPKNSGGGRITSSGVSVAVTGTTVILECTRGDRLFVLEGGARISLRKYPSQFQNLRAGQMVDVPPGAKTIPPPTNFDINDLMRKHPLITDFPPLPSRDLIVAASQQQPPQNGPSIFPIVPVINLFGGGLTGGHRRNPPGSQTQPPTTQPPTTRPPVTGQGTGAGVNTTTSTPPPVIYRPSPGRTRVPPATGTTTQTKPQPTPPPRKRVIKKPNQTNNGPR
jgi:FecR protein